MDYLRHSRRNPTLLMIGTHVEDWAEGLDAVAALFRDEFGRFQMQADAVRAWERQDVGWIAAQLRYVSEDMAVPVRATGVALREETGWKLLQLHAHFTPG